MNKTQYRIVPMFYGREISRFLQFRSTKTIWRWFVKQSVECWRFVPNANWCRVSGDYLFETDCPTAFNDLTEIRSKSRFLCVDGEDEGRGFVATWPDIYEYLKHLRVLHAAHLVEIELIKNKANNTEIIYL